MPNIPDSDKPDQTEYSYKAVNRREDEASTTLPEKPRPFLSAKQKLRALALTGTADASKPVSDRIRLGQLANTDNEE